MAADAGSVAAPGATSAEASREPVDREIVELVGLVLLRVVAGLDNHAHGLARGRRAAGNKSIAA